MEFGKVGFEDRGSIASRVDRNEEGSEGVGAARVGVEDVNGCAELVELIGADVGAVGESKVYLSHLISIFYVLQAMPKAYY